MKKLFTYFTLITLMLATFSSCDSAQRDLRKLVKSMNEECPMSLGDSGQLVSTTYKDNVVTLNYSLRGVEGLKNFDENYDMYHSMMLESYRNTSDSSFVHILQSIVKAKASLDVVFRCDNQKKFRLSFTTDELKKNMPCDDSDPESYLCNFVERGHMELPSKFAEGMMGTDMILDKTSLTYLFECDETIFNMDEMQQSAIENHDSMRDMMLSSTDPNTIKMIDMLKQTHRSIRYVYRGTTSGKEAIFSVSPEEM